MSYVGAFQATNNFPESRWARHQRVKSSICVAPDLLNTAKKSYLVSDEAKVMIRVFLEQQLTKLLGSK
jgi:hypothetical protein